MAFFVCTFLANKLHTYHAGHAMQVVHAKRGTRHRHKAAEVLRCYLYNFASFCKPRCAPSTPGMPCRLCTPHVSRRPVFASKKSDRYVKPHDDSRPAHKQSQVMVRATLRQAERAEEANARAWHRTATDSQTQQCNHR